MHAQTQLLSLPSLPPSPTLPIHLQIRRASVAVENSIFPLGQLKSWSENVNKKFGSKTVHVELTKRNVLKHIAISPPMSTGLVKAGALPPFFSGMNSLSVLHSFLFLLLSIFCLIPTADFCHVARAGGILGSIVVKLFTKICLPLCFVYVPATESNESWKLLFETFVETCPIQHNVRSTNLLFTDGRKGVPALVENHGFTHAFCIQHLADSLVKRVLAPHTHTPPQAHTHMHANTHTLSLSTHTHTLSLSMHTHMHTHARTITHTQTHTTHTHTHTHTTHTHTRVLP
jgi:hypothetical protein